MASVIVRIMSVQIIIFVTGGSHIVRLGLMGDGSLGSARDSVNYLKIESYP